jgi:hypothetical protein
MGCDDILLTVFSCYHSPLLLSNQEWIRLLPKIGFFINVMEGNFAKKISIRQLPTVSEEPNFTTHEKNSFYFHPLFVSNHHG